MDSSQNPAKVYVGNLSWSVTSDQLKAYFAAAGKVVDAVVIMDKMNPSRSRGFGFVEFETLDEANKAIELFDQKDFEGRTLIVNLARAKTDSPPVGNFA